MPYMDSRAQKEDTRLPLLDQQEAQPMRDCHNSASEKPLHIKFSIPPMDSLFTIALLNFLFLSIKEFPFRCYGTCMVTQPWVQSVKRNCLLIWNKPIFSGEITGYLFKVNTLYSLSCFLSLNKYC